MPNVTMIAAEQKIVSTKILEATDGTELLELINNYLDGGPGHVDQVGQFIEGNPLLWAVVHKLSP